MMMWRTLDRAVLARVLMAVAGRRGGARCGLRPAAPGQGGRQATGALGRETWEPRHATAGVPHRVSSAAELLAVAHAQEEQAERGYRLLAERMRALGEAELAHLFLRLARTERAHGDAVREIARSVEARPPGTVVALGPPTEGAAPDPAAVRSPAAALAAALLAEERAFGFYAAVAATGPAPEVRQVAERLAAEELEHMAALAREERWRRPSQVRVTMEAPRSMEELRALWAEHAAEIAGRLAAGAEMAEAAGDTETAALLRALAPPAGDTAPPPRAGPVVATNVPDLLDREVAAASADFDRWVLVSHHTPCADAAAEAGRIADTALARRARLRWRLSALDAPCTETARRAAPAE